MIVLLLLTSLTFSVGCSPDIVYVDAGGWVKPIHFSPETKAWLASLEWPETAHADFDLIRKHNLKYYKFSASGSRTYKGIR